MTIEKLIKRVSDEYSGNKLYLTEDDIYFVALREKMDVDIEDITTVMVDKFKYERCILNKEDLDCFGDGDVYTPEENQECNSEEEWVYVPTLEEYGAMPRFDIDGLMD